MPDLVTYFAAVPVALSDEGRFVVDDDGAIECVDANAVIWLAELARTPGYRCIFQEGRSSHRQGMLRQKF